MANFELEEIEIEGSIHTFYKLIRDKKCYYDKFIEEIKDKFDISDEDDSDNEIVTELDELYTLIEDIALDNPVPRKKHKPLKNRPKNFPYSDFEIRTGTSRLRIYYIKEKGTGKIIILGEFKKNEKAQNKTIKRMRKIAKEYYEFIKTSKS